MGSRAVARPPDEVAGVRRTTRHRRRLHPHRPAVLPRDATTTLLARLRARRRPAGLWDELDTDWVLLDASSCPGRPRPRADRATSTPPSGAAARAALPAAVDALTRRAARGVDVTDSGPHARPRAADAHAFTEAYRRYCWPTDGSTACRWRRSRCSPPRATWADRDHGWHLDVADRLVGGRPRLLPRPPPARGRPHRRRVSAAGVAWWEELTAAGGEGMVVKPWPASPARKGLAQPGSSARPRVPADHLRPRLPAPTTGAAARARPRHKRSLALREYALGLEALDRFAARRAAVARARGGLRRPRAGVRAGRPPAVTPTISLVTGGRLG